MGIVQTRIGLFQYLLFGEKLKLHHFCIFLKVCNITALWWWYFTDDENFSRLNCQMSKLIDILEIASYLCNACVQDILISMGNIYLKILFSALPQNCILLHVAATAAHPLHHPPACLATFHLPPCWRCYLPYFADFWHYFWTCTLVAFHNFFRSDYIGNQTCAWRNESWPATLNVLFSQIRQWTECLVCDAWRWWDIVFWQHSRHIS